ncbi:Uncharacterised protein [Mycobacteroides abscessus subsp. abscessus]|nr:Uncharacterised protein [Mycobacteroides abscessus subsp. abscessus]
MEISISGMAESTDFQVIFTGNLIDAPYHIGNFRAGDRSIFKNGGGLEPCKG